ncbi:MAG: hypothetical protein ISS82_06275 [Nanoarchaeota archaeon]|nr:hypothetical protein [Nanoarchaeota archaeon]
MDEFAKWDLFNRYALDNLAGLMLETSENHPIYKRFINQKNMLDLLIRIKQVRNQIKKPDFSKKVI